VKKPERLRRNRRLHPLLDVIWSLTNHVRLQGRFTPRQALRYTPAAVPVLDGQLEGQHEVIEAGVKRSVQLLVRVRCLGPVALKMSQLPEGSVVKIHGFLAPARQASALTLVHIQSFELI
jgi:primosomal replication protein N